MENPTMTMRPMRKRMKKMNLKKRTRLTRAVAVIWCPIEVYLSSRILILRLKVKKTIIINENRFLPMKPKPNPNSKRPKQILRQTRQISKTVIILVEPTLTANRHPLIYLVSPYPIMSPRWWFMKIYSKNHLPQINLQPTFIPILQHR